LVRIDPAREDIDNGALGIFTYSFDRLLPNEAGQRFNDGNGSASPPCSRK
jgi:hypothetical protein